LSSFGYQLSELNHVSFHTTSIQIENTTLPTVENSEVTPVQSVGPRGQGHTWNFIAKDASHADMQVWAGIWGS
jgi:hypothetical protein